MVAVLGVVVVAGVQLVPGGAEMLLGALISMFLVVGIVATSHRDPGPFTTELSDLAVAVDERPPVAWYWLALLPVTLLVTLDGANRFSTGQVRYVPALLMLVPFTALAIWRRGPLVLHPLYWWLLVGWMIGIIGSLVAFTGGQENTWLQVFVAMSVVIVVPLTGLGVGQAVRLRSLATVLCWCATCYGVGSAVIWLAGLRDLSGLSAYNHEMGPLIWTGLVLAWALRLRLLVPLLAISLVVAFVAYPATTYVVVAFAALSTTVVFARRRSGVVRFGLALALAIVLAGSWAAVMVRSDLTTEYAQLVGKNDNSAFRRELWSSALAEVADAPFVGQFFMGRYAASTSPGMRFVQGEYPLHNEFLGLLRGGGVFGLLLVVGPVLALVPVVSRRLRAADASDRRIGAAIIGSAVAFMFAAGFNAPIARVPTAVFGWLASALLVAAATVEWPSSAEVPDGVGIRESVGAG